MERLPGEGEQEWTALWRWRDAGGPELKDFAATTGYPYEALKRWRSRWGWDERMRDWSNEVDGVRQKATLTATQEMAARHIALAGLGLTIVETALRKIQADLKTDYGRLKAQEIARLLDVCAKLERLSRGEATEISSGANYAGLSNEDLAILEAIGKKL